MEWNFGNVIPVFRDGEIKKFNTSISAANLAKMFNIGVLIYDAEIQRGKKVTKKGKEKDFYSPKHVKEILEAIISGKIHGGCITLNYSKNNEVELQYDEQEGTISGDGVLQIVDGSHRIRASAMLLDMYEKDKNSVPNPDLFNFPVVIENLTDDDAKTLFSEYVSCGLPISKTRAKYLNVGDLSNKVSRKVMNESELKEKVELISTSIKGKNAIVTFSVLNDLIKNNFKLTTKKEAEKTEKFLIKFFDELIGELFPSQLGNIDIHSRNEQRKVSMILEPIMWNSLGFVASQLIEDKEWKSKLARLNDTVKVGEWEGNFLDKSNPLWTEKIMRDENKIVNNSSTQSYVTKVISNYILTGNIDTEQLAS